ncbi:amino acid permease 4 [Corchorus olitorius]|uniref:Amino acid permease 4 n=1 Tax=Corchorus olitorius TaxID=93759 RepID=A0A1R3K9D5_9ROSI|nr:amino acid permease 4 [Corchorus olitorius]
MIRERKHLSGNPSNLEMKVTEIWSETRDGGGLWWESAVAAMEVGLGDAALHKRRERSVRTERETRERERRGEGAGDSGKVRAEGGDVAG